MNSALAPLLADASAARSRRGEIKFIAAAPAPLAILGVPIDALRISDALDRIDAMIATRRPHFVATASVQTLVQAQRDAEVRDSFLQADLVLSESPALRWSAARLGGAFPQALQPADFAREIVRRVVSRSHRLFVLGTGEMTGGDVEVALQHFHPALHLAGAHIADSTELLLVDEAEIARRVHSANPDILLVAAGCAKRQKWIAAHYRALGVPVTIAVGAETIALLEPAALAPEWTKRSAGGRLARLAGMARRLYRPCVRHVLRVVAGIASQWLLSSRRARTRIEPGDYPFNIPDWSCIDAGTQLTRCSLETDAEFWQQARDRATHCLIDLAKTQAIDGHGIGFLLRWRKHLAASDRQLVLLAPSGTVRRLLGLMKLTAHFVVAKDFGAAAAHATHIGRKSLVQHDGTTRSLAWCGEIVADNVDDVWRMTTEHVAGFAAAEATLVIIDLARLRGIDSTGAALMLRLKKWARSVRTEILFAHAQPNVRNVLRLTQVEQLLLEGGQ